MKYILNYTCRLLSTLPQLHSKSVAVKKKSDEIYSDDEGANFRCKNPSINVCLKNAYV